MFGNFQVMWKHRAMLFRPKYGMLGMLTMPYAIAQLLLNLLFLPILLVVAGVTLAQGDWQPVAVFAVVVLVMHTVIAITAVTIARERLWHLLVVPIYRPIYEAMRVYLLYATAYRVMPRYRRCGQVVTRKDQDGETMTGGDAAGSTGGRKRRLRMA